MSLPDLVVRLYRFFGGRRPLLYGLSLLAILLGVAASTGIRTEENIEAMLPDRRGGVAEDFRLLQRAPFARKVLITLKAEGETGVSELTAAADRLSALLDPSLFGEVMTGPDARLQGRLVNWLEDALPGILDDRDLEALAADLDGDGVRRRLRENYEHLLAPEGWALKGIIRRDPLSFYKAGLEKLRYANLIPEMRLVDNHFVSADGKSAMLIADTPVPMTDSAGARRLEAGFGDAVRKAVPAGIRAEMISGHRYTLANAEAVQGDVSRILTASILAILALFLFFMRGIRAGFVFLLPVAAVCVAAVAVSWFFPTVSAITIGLGGALLGITVDYGIYVYVALRHGRGEAEAILKRVARPVFFGGITTLAVFAIMLFSAMPGPRQIAVFSIAGIGAAIVMSLVVLPHLIPAGAGEGREEGGPERDTLADRWLSGVRGRRNWILTGWIVVLALCAWQATGLKFNGDLRRMSLVPPELAAAEQELRKTWGDFRGQAMLWARGADLEQALEANGRLFSLLKRELPAEPLVSLAPLLPSDAVQRANHARWQEFWEGDRGRRILAALQREAAALGFSADAFNPFFEALASPPKPVTAKGMREAGLGRLVESLVVEQDGKTAVLTLVPDRPELIGLVEGRMPGEVRLVSQGRFRQEISAVIGNDFLRFFVLSLAVVGLLLVPMYRRVGRVVAAAVPAITGLAIMLGVMGALGIEFNLFNVIAGILVIGPGIDYGIFMVCVAAEGLDRSTAKAVLISGMTTLAGFGALVLAKHPAMHSIGVTVLLGIGGAIVTALVVVPALFVGKPGQERG